MALPRLEDETDEQYYRREAFLTRQTYLKTQRGEGRRVMYYALAALIATQVLIIILSVFY